MDSTESKMENAIVPNMIHARAVAPFDSIGSGCQERDTASIRQLISREGMRCNREVLLSFRSKLRNRNMSSWDS